MFNCAPQECRPFISDKEKREDYEKRLERDIYTDIKFGVDALKAFEDKLNTLHPDVKHKIYRLMGL